VPCLGSLFVPSCQTQVKDKGVVPGVSIITQIGFQQLIFLYKILFISSIYYEYLLIFCNSFFDILHILYTRQKQRI
jgi:hypothetical protein